MVLLMQLRTAFASLVAASQGWLILNLWSAITPRSLSSVVLPSQVSPILYVHICFFFSRCSIELFFTEFHFVFCSSVLQFIKNLWILISPTTLPAPPRFVLSAHSITTFLLTPPESIIKMLNSRGYRTEPFGMSFETTCQSDALTNNLAYGFVQPIMCSLNGNSIKVAFFTVIRKACGAIKSLTKVQAYDVHCIFLIHQTIYPNKDKNLILWPNWVLINPCWLLLISSPSRCLQIDCFISCRSNFRDQSIIPWILLLSSSCQGWALFQSSDDPHLSSRNLQIWPATLRCLQLALAP